MLSIVTPVLNGADFIENNIKEITRLNIPFEHIIVDGGSTDGTLDIVKDFKHIRLLHQNEKTGMYGAIHQGFIAAKGEYFAYVNADDKIVASGYEKMYQRILASKIDIVYSDSMLLYSNPDKIVKHHANRFAKFFLKRGILPFIQPSALFTKHIYFLHGGLRFDRFRICGDMDFFYRIATEKESVFSYIPCFSTIFLVRKDSLGNTNSAAGYNERVKNNIPVSATITDRILYKMTSFI